MTTYYQPALVGEALVGNGQFTTPVTAAQVQTGQLIKGAPGRLCRVLVTTTTTAAQAITIYDNATTGSGTVIGLIPGATAAGTVIDFEMPATNGIYVGTNASLAAGGITISWV